MALSAISLLVTMFGMAATQAFAWDAHPTCTTTHHDCGKTAAIAKCCCSDEQPSQTDSTPSQSRVDLRVDLSSMPVVMSATPVPANTLETFAIDASPPHRANLDLSTLFSALLI